MLLFDIAEQTQACCQQLAPLWLACYRNIQVVSRLKMTRKQSRRDKSICHRGESATWSQSCALCHGRPQQTQLLVSACDSFYVSLLATAIRAPCTLIPWVHRLKRSSPAGNRKSPSLLANDDATGFLAFAHDRCNQHQQRKGKQTLIDNGIKTAAA